MLPAKSFTHFHVLASFMSGLQNDLLCIQWDVKPYMLTHSLHFMRYPKLVSFLQIHISNMTISLKFQLPTPH